MTISSSTSPSARNQLTAAPTYSGPTSKLTQELSTKSQISEQITHSPSHSHEASATSPGKFILCGEHSVVFGSRALAMPLPHTAMTLTAKRHLRNRRGAKSSHSIMVNGRNLISDLLPTLNQAIDLLTPKNYPKGRSSSTYHISIDTHIPLGAGLGASAALSITLLRSLAELHHKKLSTEQVMQLAHELEKTLPRKPIWR